MASPEPKPKRSAPSLLHKAGTARRLARGGKSDPAAGGAQCRYLAVIMDGNGRWAKRRHLPVAAGHKAGAKALRRLIERALDHGLAEVTVYSFSSENWRRPPDEVAALMELFVEQIEAEVPEVQSQGVRVRFLGRKEGVSPELLQRIDAAEAANPATPAMTMYIAFNYGARDEIVDAARALAAAAAGQIAARPDGASGPGLDELITEDALKACLYAPEMHERRGAHLQLPALAARLHRALLHGQALARLRSRRLRRGARGLRHARPTLRRPMTAASPGRSALRLTGDSPC